MATDEHNYYIYLYLYIYIERERDLEREMHIHIYIYIYIYIHPASSVESLLGESLLGWSLGSSVLEPDTTS